MKSDNFDDFVRENRDAFGPGVAAPDVWAKIKKREPEAKTMHISWQRVMYRAASVVIIFVASYYFHDYMSGNNKGFAETYNMDNPLFKELMEADVYYSAEISSKKQELFSLTGNEPGLQMDINNDLGDLDAILLELKEDLKDNADNREVVEAMMQNYMLKLEILEDMLDQIKGNKENDDDEKGFSI